MEVIHVYQKGQPEQVTEHFVSTEFDCPCKREDCRETKISWDLLEFLEAIRVRVKVPLTITSGFRCAGHQGDLEEQGYPTAKYSKHLTGEAADLVATGHTGKRLEQVARGVGVMAVGTARSWIHIDTRSDKRRAWTY